MSSTDVRAVRRRRRVHRLPVRARGDRRGRADRRRRHPQRAGRPARVAEADRQRELRVARGAAHHGHLALRQVRRGHHRSPVLRGCQNIDTVEQAAADHAKELFNAPHAYVQPHSGIDANLVAFWAILAQRIESPALAKAGAKHVNDLTDEDWQTAAPRPRQPARAGHVAGCRRSPDPRLPAEHQRQDVRAGVVRHRSRDRPAGLRRAPRQGSRVQAAGADRRVLRLPAADQLRHHARDRRRGRGCADGRHGPLRRAGRRARCSPATSTRCRMLTSRPPRRTSRCAGRVAAWCCASRSSPMPSTAAARWCSAGRSVM